MDRKAAEQWMQQGIRQHELFNKHITGARTVAVNAGLFFTSARAAYDDGDWGLFLSGYSHKIKPRAVYFYMELTREALEWAKTEHPQLTGAKLEEMAKTMIMMSPKPLVALCRELGYMRKFGEYDAVKYAAQKRLGNGAHQLELEFETVMKWLDPFKHIGESNCRLVLPDGMDERKALQELDAALGEALNKVRAQMKGTIET